MRSEADESALEAVVRAYLFPLRVVGVGITVVGALLALTVGLDEAHRARAGNDVNVAAWALVVVGLLLALGGLRVLRSGLAVRRNPLFEALTTDAPAIRSVEVIARLHHSDCLARLSLADGRTFELIVPGDEARVRSLFRHVAPGAAALHVEDRRMGAPLERPGLVFDTDGEQVLRLTAVVEQQLRPLRRTGYGLLVAAAALVGVGWLEWRDRGLDGPAPDTSQWAGGLAIVLLVVGAALVWRHARVSAHPLYDVLVNHRAEITAIEQVRVVNSWADRLIVRSPRAPTPVRLIVDHRERDAVVELLERASGVRARQSEATEPPRGLS